MDGVIIESHAGLERAFGKELLERIHEPRGVPAR